ncbi:MAG: hypothetical protein KDC34_07335 [Saprospiraceae bacterium]|nr:hypothetical protein [Saprospiraceae bacterium]
MIGRIKIEILCCFISIVFSGCFIVPQCEDPNYLFEIDFTISPGSNLYSIGDTIKVSSIIGPYVEDQKTGELIDCGEKFLFPLQINLAQYDSTTTYSSNFDFFTIASVGTIDSLMYSDGELDVRYNINSNSFQRQLEFYLIPQEVGIYTLSIGFISIHYLDGFLLTDDDCSESAILEFRTNNNTGLGYDLVVSTGYSGLISYDRYEKFGSYSFEVVE